MKQIFHGHTGTPKERISRIGVSTIFLLLSLASLAVSQSSAPRVAVQRCNKVILGYFRDTIKFHEYPIIDTWVRACDDEYANYKGCCDTDSLREMMKKFVMSDALRWNNALVKVNLFDKEVVKNSAALKAKIDKFRPELQKRVEAKTLNSSVIDSANYLSTFLPLMTNTTYQTRLEAYKGQAQACFDTITQIRKGAMCIICSSRATQFYKNQIMNIKQSTCDAVVRDCYANFQFMFTVVTTLQSLFEVANAVNPEVNFPLGTDPVPTKSISTIAMMNGTNLTNLTVGIRTEFCETHLFLGRPNDQLEGFNDLISKANGIADAILKSSDTPNYKILETRPTSLFMRIKVDVLSDLEPNGEDLTKIDPRVSTKNKILVEKTGKSAWMIMTTAWVTALAGTVSLLTA